MEVQRVDADQYDLITTAERLSDVRDIFRTIIHFSDDLSPEFTNEHVADVTNRDILTLKAMMDKAVDSGKLGFVLSSKQMRSFFNVFIELDATPFDASLAGLEQQMYQDISKQVEALIHKFNQIHYG